MRLYVLDLSSYTLKKNPEPEKIMVYKGLV
jgi:hypothetical protein